MKDSNQRIIKFKNKLDGDVYKKRIDAYRSFQIKNFSASVGDQVKIENQVKSFMVANNIPLLNTNYYMLFLKRILSERFYKSQEEADISFNKWAIRGLPFYHLRFLGRTIARRLLNLKSLNPIDILDFHATFYEGSGNVVHDLSGNNLNGVPNGNGWTTDGKIGNAFEFGAGTGEYIRFDHDPIFQISGKAFSVCFWAKPKLPFATPPFANALFGKVGIPLAPATAEYAVFMDDTNGLSMAISNGVAFTNISLIPIADLLLLVDTWVFGAFTTDGTNMDLYINNNLYASVVLPLVTNTTTSPFWIGGNSAPGNPFKCNGTVDEVKFFNRKLTHKEVMEIYLGEK